MGRPPCCDKVGVKKGPWTPEEDIMLVTYVQEHGPGNWRAVPDNTGFFISSAYINLTYSFFLSFFTTNSKIFGCRILISEFGLLRDFDPSGLRRCSKSCRLRWTNYLRPGIKRGNFTDQEEKMIIQLQALLGNKYAS